nr:folate-binding protein [Notoacmeibacter sp. MSK16QG-6]
MKDDEVRPAALLTPQGKVAYPFLISRIEKGFLIDTEDHRSDDLATRFNLYRMRAKVSVEKLDQTHVALGVDVDNGLTDRRFPAPENVHRLYGADADGAPADADAVTELRIRHCVPEADKDYTVGEAFAFDILLDQLGGLSLRKGCFVGQEVVSRMYHRGTARRRIVQITADSNLPEGGTPLIADEKPVGELGTVSGQSGLAMVRIDRVAAALGKTLPILADETPVQIAVPDRFSFSIEPAAPNEASEA